MSYCFGLSEHCVVMMLSTQSSSYILPQPFPNYTTRSSDSQQKRSSSSNLSLPSRSHSIMKPFSYDFWGVSSKGFDSSHSFVRSHFVSPVVLASFRALFCIYSFATIITCYAWLTHGTATISLKDVNIASYTVHQDDRTIGQSFSILSYLAFWSSGFYFLVASVHTFMYAFRQRTWLQRWPRPLQLAHTLFYSTITSFPLLITVVSWTTMSAGWPAGRFEQWINFSVHGLNSIFAFTEIILPATQPLPWIHLPFIMVVLSMYLGLAYLTRATQGFYIYEWMNPAHGKGSIVLHIAVYAAAMITLFVLVRYMIVLRNKLADKLELTRFRGGERNVRLYDRTNSDTWSVQIAMAEPKQIRRSSKGYFYVV